MSKGIAIARALLVNPKLLLLDESLDSEAEYLVQEAFDRVMRDRTVFVIGWLATFFFYLFLLFFFFVFFFVRSHNSLIICFCFVFFFVSLFCCVCFCLCFSTKQISSSPEYSAQCGQSHCAQSRQCR